jgi:hypothetical protein
MRPDELQHLLGVMMLFISCSQSLPTATSNFFYLLMGSAQFSVICHATLDLLVPVFLKVSF